MLSDTTTSRLLTEREVAERLSITVAALRRWRTIGAGPPYRKLGALVRYDPADLRKSLQSLPTGGQPVQREASIAKQSAGRARSEVEGG